jgi:hypothetical protein
VVIVFDLALGESENIGGLVMVANNGETSLGGGARFMVERRDELVNVV